MQIVVAQGRFRFSRSATVARIWSLRAFAALFFWRITAIFNLPVLSDAAFITPLRALRALPLFALSLVERVLQNYQISKFTLDTTHD
jgi:hypothetical protein